MKTLTITFMALFILAFSIQAMPQAVEPYRPEIIWTMWPSADKARAVHIKYIIAVCGLSRGISVEATPMEILDGAGVVQKVVRVDCIRAMPKKIGV